MTDIVIFGGTSEGRRLAELCASCFVPAAVSVVTEYGAELLPDSPWLEIHTGPMEREEMEQWLKEKRPSLVLDATHPYAAQVTENIRLCCQALGLRRLRVRRGQEETGGSRGLQITEVGTVEEAVAFLKDREGNILVTTGSKELKAFTALEDYRTRVFARVLPSSGVLTACETMGIPGSRILAMQGPFSVEMNRAMLRRADARWLVTKEAGAAGGFEEKLQAAAETGTAVVVVGRPADETGVSLKQAEAEIETRAAEKEKPEEAGTGERGTLILAGAGMGTEESMTLEAVQAVRRSEAVFGAPRLSALADRLREQERHDFSAVSRYMPEPVFQWLESHGECRSAAVLFSGDTGFYSGTAGFLKYMKEHGLEDRWTVRILPGISSLSSMAAALGKSWEDAVIASRHGRDQDIRTLAERHEKVFVLTGGSCRAERICGELKGLKVQVSVGENLGSSRERIRTGTPEELAKEQFDSLAVVWIEKEDRN